MTGFSVPCFNTLAHKFPGEAGLHLFEQTYFEGKKWKIS